MVFVIRVFSLSKLMVFRAWFNRNWISYQATGVRLSLADAGR
jgi:hypothetical protein